MRHQQQLKQYAPGRVVLHTVSCRTTSCAHWSCVCCRVFRLPTYSVLSVGHGVGAPSRYLRTTQQYCSNVDTTLLQTHPSIRPPALHRPRRSAAHASRVQTKGTCNSNPLPTCVTTAVLTLAHAAFDSPDRRTGTQFIVPARLSPRIDAHAPWRLSKHTPHARSPYSFF